METKTLPLYLKRRISTPIYIEGFNETDSKKAKFSPSISVSFSPSIIQNLEISFSIPLVVSIDTPDTTPVTYTLTVLGTSDDCTTNIKLKNFDNQGNILYMGNVNGGKNWSWIPFNINFSASSVDNGIHIKTATLTLSSYDTKIVKDKKFCKVYIGFDRTRNSTVPTTSSRITSKQITNRKFSGSISESWAEGEQYEFDMTSALKELMAASQDTSGSLSMRNVSWISGCAAVVARDWGSTKGEYRSIVSYEGSLADPSTPAPTLEIVYEDNYYDNIIFDTYISDTDANEDIVFYNNQYLIVGELTNSKSVQRGLFKANLDSIPAGATITAAKLRLYLQRNRATTTGSLLAYEMENNWDLYGASWNSRIGTQLWTTAGAFGTDIPIDVSSTISGSAKVLYNQNHDRFL